MRMNTKDVRLGGTELIRPGVPNTRKHGGILYEGVTHRARAYHGQSDVLPAAEIIDPLFEHLHPWILLPE